ncbi:hypothetical protein IE53DRAFT_5465 [Violaceomyces palustris]|uniref:Uncharacterized protein n=1 Tax=Violaceomyces palustris TaxID=1673888 RepID=A0ACD0NM02_9BASI|nr:hypothetical protein IE53DRAFT_5465 [Violaceomyces palustris]
MRWGGGGGGRHLNTLTFVKPPVQLVFFFQHCPSSLSFLYVSFFKKNLSLSCFPRFPVSKSQSHPTLFFFFPTVSLLFQGTPTAGLVGPFTWTGGMWILSEASVLTLNFH